MPQISENKEQNYQHNFGFHIMNYPNQILHLPPPPPSPPVTTYGAQHAVGGGSGVGVGDANDGTGEDV